MPALRRHLSRHRGPWAIPTPSTVATRSAWLSGPCVAQWAGGSGIRNPDPLQSIRYIQLILVLDLAQAHSHPIHGLQPAQQPRTRFTEPVKAKLYRLVTMPTKNNDTFIDGDPTWANACVGENGFPGYWEYAKGFSQAATILIEMILRGQGLKHSVDMMVYPVCFNMRHSVELRLKDAILELIHIEKYRIRNLRFDFAGSHDIGNIWTFFAENARSVDDRYEPIISRLDKRIADIAEVDATGQTFRYPLDTESQKHLVDVGVINLVVLKERFADLEAALDDLHHLSRYLLNEYAWGCFTKRMSRKNLFELASLLPRRSAWADESFGAIKKAIKERFKIGSKELSESIKRIESHFELAPVIGARIPMLGVEEDDVQEFFCHWFNQHDVPSDQVPIDLEVIEWGSDGWLETTERHSRIRSEVWSTVKSDLTAEKLAGVSALFYFALELEFSECYIRIYQTGLEEAQLAFADSEDSVRTKYFHLFDKTNAIYNILRSLYFLRKAELADQLVAAHGLDEKFSWLDDAKNRILFRKPDYYGYAI